MDVQLTEAGAGFHRVLEVRALPRLQVIDRDDLGPRHQRIGDVTPVETRAGGYHYLRPGHSRDATHGAYSRFLRCPQMGEEWGDGPRPMGEAVLFGEGHLGEGLGRTLRDENRIEAEAPGPGLAGRDRPWALSVKHFVGVALPEQEDRLEGRGAGFAFREEPEDARASEALLNVRRIDAREAAEGVEEEARAVDQVVAGDLVVEDRGREPHDFLEAVRLDLRVAPVLPHDADAGLGEGRGHLAELAFVRRHESDHV